MQLVRNISRYIIGLMFIFSGFVKAIDPLGSTYKFADYFMAFHIDWLEPSALFFAITLAAIEFAIGFALLSNVVTRISSTIMFIFMSFFTVLTLYLAIANPVSDCGCFGDAIKLTNWGAFYKNVILMIPASIVFWQRDKFQPLFNKPVQIFIVGVGLLLSLYSSKNAYQHLPAIDYRAYKIGTDIHLAMNEEWIGAPQPLFETAVVYEKNGKQKSFAADNLPDSTWKWVETQSKLINQGYEAPVQNFNITNENKQDVTDYILNFDGFTLMMVAYDMEKIPKKTYASIKEIRDISEANGHNFFFLTASNPEDVKTISRQYGLTGDYYYADPVTLKTIIRSTPGLVLLNKGTILNKWHYNDFPEEGQLSEYDLYQSSLQKRNDKSMMLTMGFLGLWVLVIAFLEIVGLKSTTR
ncbi:MAG: DoxX family protein [Salinivirgaceae bacterium]|jgi:uncharacterized membrane protein YphA (DoxX/SURF4 family)|nr:DoxX family protein [Salinivirgaceae bacterium]